MTPSQSKIAPGSGETDDGTGDELIAGLALQALQGRQGIQLLQFRGVLLGLLGVEIDLVRIFVEFEFVETVYGRLRGLRKVVQVLDLHAIQASYDQVVQLLVADSISG